MRCCEGDDGTDMGMEANWCELLVGDLNKHADPGVGDILCPSQVTPRLRSKFSSACGFYSWYFRRSQADAVRGTDR